MGEVGHKVNIEEGIFNISPLEDSAFQSWRTGGLICIFPFGSHENV